MNYIKLLWTQSFQEWNFFYELHKNWEFNKNAYQELIWYIQWYKKEIKNDDYIHKDIVSQIYLWKELFGWISDMFDEWKITIKGIKDSNELEDYYNTLEFEIMQLLSIEV